MEASLYAPGVLPHPRGEGRLYTAPELHPVFGEILAREAARTFNALVEAKVPEPYFLVEMGSGNGTLARPSRRRCVSGIPNGRAARAWRS